MGPREIAAIATGASGTVRALNSGMSARLKRVIAPGSGASWATGAAGVAAGGYAALVCAAVAALRQGCAFAEPGFVKIAWTLRADAIGGSATTFRTETRVVTTDDDARRRFRWYWARFSPGIVLIRHVLIRHALIAALTRDAERRWRDALASTAAQPAPS